MRSYMTCRHVFASSLLLLLPLSGRLAAEPTEWTVMIYGCGDSSAEGHLMPPLKSLAHHSRKGQNGNVILLFDRAPGFSSEADLFGEDFEDTRLFELREGQWHRIGGGDAFPEITTNSNFEANTGDADTLKKFIRVGKAAYPARKYALIAFGHGDARGFCPDGSQRNEHGLEDQIYTAEITERLSAKDSVEFAWFDVCTYGTIENAYQFRPRRGQFSINAMIATPPSSSPAPMGDILKRAGLLGQQETDATAPSNGVEFGAIAIRLTREYWHQLPADDPERSFQAWGCYDLSKVEDAKRAVDGLARHLASMELKERLEAIRGSGTQKGVQPYFPLDSSVDWVTSPHFDLFDLAQKIAQSHEFSTEVRTAAKELMTAVDAMITASFGMEYYPGFEDGRNGIAITFPDGDAEFRGKRHWHWFDWYHPDARDGLRRYAYGRYDWCKIGAKTANDKVENWFELLDFWFDAHETSGGMNGYRW